MEVRSGYKLTAAGVIPADWDARAVSEFAQIKTGPFGTLLKAAEYSDREGVPIISVGEIGAGRFKITEHTPLAPNAVVRRLPQYVLHSGDVVFGRKGAVERSALVTEAEDGWFLGSDGIAIRPRDGCHSPYLAAQFQSHEVQSWLLQNATGTTMASLNQAILGRVQVPIPPLPEQRAIAEAFSNVDALLAGLDRLIAKKRDLKQAAMQQLLTGQTRLSGFHGEWDAATLGSVISALDAGASVNSVNEDADAFDGMFVLKTSSVLGGRFVPSECKRIAPSDLSRASINPLKGTIVVSRMNTPDLVGECGYVDRDYPNLFLPDRLWMVRFNQDMHVCGHFLAYLLSTTELKQRIAAAATGTSGSMKNLSKQAFLEIPIALPKGIEQTAIATILSDMDAEITALEARRHKTRLLKQGMMQELLTGRIRLV